MIRSLNKIKPYLIVVILAGMLILPLESLGQKGNKKEKDNRKQDNASLFIEANSQKLLGNYDAARELFLKCLEYDDQDAASMYELARIARIRNQSIEALEWAEKAVETDPENVWYMKLLAELYQENMQFDKSIVVMEKLVELHPNNLEYLYELALSNLLVGNYEESIDIYNEIEEKIGITEEISIQKQKIWMRMEKSKKAISEIERLCEAWPDETRYKSILAELYMSNGMDEKALKTYLEIIESDPDDAYIQISLSDYYRKKGEFEKSFEHLKIGFANPNLSIDAKIQILLTYFTEKAFFDEQKEEAFDLAEILVTTHPEEPKAYSIQADLYYQGEEWSKARDALRIVIGLDSSKYMVWEQLLFTDSNLEDFESMRQDSRRTIELFPQQPLPYLFAAVASYNFEEHQQMVKYLERGIKFVVRNDLLKAEFYNYLGDAYHQTDQDEKAFEAYDASLKIKPDNSIVLNNYAYYLSLNGKELERARTMAKKATELDPENASNQDTYGWVLYKLGEYEEALEWIGKAIENHNTDNAEVLEHYGDVLYKLDQKEEAKKYWEKAQIAGEGGSELLEKKVNEGILYE